jgi:hypothetical protein
MTEIVGSRRNGNDHKRIVFGSYEDFDLAFTFLQRMTDCFRDWYFNLQSAEKKGE